MSTPRSERPGLQAERTVLAWDRTALGLLVTGGLLVRDVSAGGPWPLLAAAGAALLLSLLAASIGRRRARRIQGLDSGHPAPATREVTAIGGGVIVLGLLIAVTAAL